MVLHASDECMIPGFFEITSVLCQPWKVTGRGGKYSSYMHSFILNACLWWTYKSAVIVIEDAVVIIN